MKKLQVISYFIGILCASSCGDSYVSDNANDDFKVDTIAILNYFDEEEFENDTLPQLLNEIGICNLHKSVRESSADSVNDCTSRNYKFFKYNFNMPWTEGFGLEIRATVNDFPLRRFILFERIDGKLVKSRGFVANLAEIHTNPHGFNDLLLLFPDKEAGSFVVKYVYNLNEKSYEFGALEAIDGYIVKQERKDSLSNVVLQRLNDNHMFF